MREKQHASLRQDSALFVDFDGTLADIALRPDEAALAPGMVGVLAALHAKLNGALAVISGRTLAQLDDFLAPLRLPAAGLHGAQRRSASGAITCLHAADLSEVAERLQALATAHPGLLVERKPGAIALHYRLAPQCEALCHSAMEAALAHSPGMDLLAGKMVVELKPAAASKGRAIQAFMREPPFAGRLALFAGDDSTDESGFAAVQAVGGAGIKVGPGATQAFHRFSTPHSLRAWLKAAAGGDVMTLQELP